MTILVRSTPEDLHADAVLWGLRAVGAPAAFWNARGHPGRQSLSAYVDASDRQFVDEPDGTIELADIGTFWNRRSAPPEVAENLDRRDVAFVEDQSRCHVRSVLGVACPDAMWVNPPEAAASELDKLGQLRLAREVGFRIPETLASSSPERIREFYDALDGRVVFKSYRLGVWTDGPTSGRPLVSYTTTVERSSLDDASLRMAPGLFQRALDRSHEIRVTLMGRTTFAARIDLPRERADVADWRLLPPQAVAIERVSLPREIERSILAYARRAGLLFACFDLIVDRDGEWHFLEVNQMGQFLWKEERVPELPLLDAMCAFLASANPHFVYTEPYTGLAFADYIATGRHAHLARRCEPRPPTRPLVGDGNLRAASAEAA